MPDPQKGLSDEENRQRALSEDKTIPFPKSRSEERRLLIQLPETVKKLKGAIEERNETINLLNKEVQHLKNDWSEAKSALERANNALNAQRKLAAEWREIATLWEARLNETLELMKPKMNRGEADEGNGRKDA